MSLPYPNEHDITLSERISAVLLNKIFTRFVANDNSILPSTYKIPYVWEATWFNDPTVSGYSKGDAVWINTENVQEFISNNRDRIYGYLLNNQEYRDRLIRCGDDWKKRYKLFEEVVNGGKLYYLGDISKPAQIRVCKENFVKSTPDDDRFWEDFFVVRDDGKLKQQVVEEFQRITDEQFENHLEVYHPESQSDFKPSLYMLNDFSNATATQKYNKTSILKMDGLDYVKKFVCKRYDDNNVKWFRIWSSGFLEHGGIVDAQDPRGDDTLVYEQTTGKFFTVFLDWKYNGNMAAPQFDYQNTSVEGFHFADGDIALNQDIGNGADRIRYDDVAELGNHPRYFLSITPHNVSGSVYQSMNPTYGFYNTKEALSMKNKQFTFILNDDCRYYSYYASGFTINVAKRF